MNIIRHLILCFLLFVFYFINICNASINNKSGFDIRNNNSNNKSRGEDLKKKITERKLKEVSFNCSEEDHNIKYFYPLNIYIDTAEFNATFPDDEELNRDNFIIAMNKAKSILEDLLEIRSDACGDGIILRDDKHDYVEENYEISNYTSVFEGNYLSIGKYNYFILAKFTEDIGEGSASVILDNYVYSPVVGIILFNNNTEYLEKLDKSKFTINYLTNLMLHHFIRLLGFNPSIEEFSSEKYIPYDDEKGVYYLSLYGENNFTNVINYAIKYFNCTSIERIDLYEDDENLDESGFHYEYGINDIIGLYWPKRLFLGELMTKFDYPEEQVLSGFTLAFLDDLPYLRVVKNYTGGLMKFGKNKGCDFFYNNCGNSSVSSYTFANEFYLPLIPPEIMVPSCSSGRLSKTKYKLYQIEEEDENDEDKIFEYILDNKIGPKSTNYCPIAQYDYESNPNRKIYSGRCSEINSEERDLVRKEELGDNSFCVLSSLVESGSSDPEVKSLCYEMSCSSRSLTIKIGDYYIVCPREGGKVQANNFIGYLLCPDYNLICTSSELCNSIIDCYDKNSTELEETFYYDYDIQTTQDSNVYKESNRSYGWELSENGKCPFECMQCTSKTNCIRCRPNYIYENGECKKAVDNCKVFVSEENDLCKKCDDGYFLVEKSEDERYCENNSNKGKFYVIDDTEGFEIYKECEIDNCNTCIKDEDFEKKVKCDSCTEPFKKIDNGLFCGDISTQEYYEESTGIFKSCIKHESFHNCLKCQKSDSFICLECESDFVLFYGTSPPSCIERSSTNPTMYHTDDKNYYPCNNRLYHNIDHCEECENKEECKNCSSGYTLANGTSLCILTTEIDDQKYYKDPNNNYYYKCPDACETCESATKCLTCNSPYKPEESYACIDPSLVDEFLYYYNSDISRYSKCSNIPGCYTCQLESTNQPKCLSCDLSNGYHFVEGDDNQLTCQIPVTNKYYLYDAGEGNTYYKKCSKAIEKCDECTADNYCTKCLSGFGIIIDDHTQCQITDGKYYYYNEKYYPCNNQLYHNVKNCEKCNNKIECEECSSGYTLANGTSLCILTSEINDKKYYKDPNNNNYYKCPDTCETCESATKCLTCKSPYLLEENNACIDPSLFSEHFYYYNNDISRYSKCSNIPGCNKCLSGTECISCDSANGYYFVENEENQLICQKININKYYEFADNDKTYYKPCSEAMDHCDECSAQNHCSLCITHYGIVDNDHTKCESIDDKYYYDTSLSTFKLCSNKMANCELCSADGEYACKKCFNNYAFKHTNTLECAQKTSLEGDTHFFSNDTGINYYSCSLYGLIEHCDKCSNKDTCDSCITGYELYNVNKLCALHREIENNIYIFTNDGLLTPCSALIQNCQKCNDSSTCLECQDDSALIDNNTCANKTEIEENKNYFKDEKTNMYISCSVMDNCVTCASSADCTSCKNGFTLNNKKCVNNNENGKNDNDDGLSTGAIIGIVFGCLGFLLIISGIGYFVFNKFFKRDKNIVKPDINEKVEIKEEKFENNPEIDDKELENVKQNAVVVHSTKRSIHNG